MKDFTIRMMLTGKDGGASKLLKQWSEDVKKANADAAKSSQQFNQRQENGTRRAMSQRQRNMAAMARLGVRSERDIQREINQTIAAYNRLAKSGTMSQKELQRASKATKEQISSLRQELGQTSRIQRVINGGRIVAGVAGAVAAGNAVLNEPIQKRRDFDLELAYAANTAFADRDVQGRISGKKELYGSVKNAVQKGGGSRDDALAGLNTMIASGAVKIDVAKSLLPTLQKAAVATGGSTEDMAKIAIAAMQNFKINENQISQVFDKVAAAGQAGNFEPADMARWLPQQLAAAQNTGMSGMADFEVMLRANQQVRTTAGSSDEAGNNFVNLLAKITSQDAITKFSKVEYRDTDGKIKGIDLSKSLLERKAKGENVLDAFIGIIDKMMASNKQYQQLQEQINKAKGDEKKRLMEQQASILEGTAIGEVVSDRQALMALLGIRNNKILGQEVSGAIKNSSGSIDKSHDVIMDTTHAKAQNKDNAKDFGQMESLEGLDNALGNLDQKIADYAEKYPALGTAMAGTELAFRTLAAMVATAGAMMWALGKNPLDLLPGKNGAGVPKPSGGTPAPSSGGWGRWGGRLLKFAKFNFAADLAFHSESLNEGEDGRMRELRTRSQQVRRPLSAEAIRRQQQQQALGGTKAAAGQPPALPIEKMQPMFMKQTADFQAAMQTNTSTLGGQLDRINGTLASQQQTIQNNISVMLDGRVVAEQVSRQQYSMFNRGGAQ